MDTLKPQSSGPLYISMVIGTLAVDGWTVTFGTAMRGLGGLRPRPGPSSIRCGASLNSKGLISYEDTSSAMFIVCVVDSVRQAARRVHCQPTRSVNATTW